MPSQRTAMHDAARSMDIRTALPATRQKPRAIQEERQTMSRRPFHPPHRTIERSKRKHIGLHQRNGPFQRAKPQKKPFWQKCQLKQCNSKASDNRFSMTSTTLSTDSVYEGNKRPAKSGRDSTEMDRKSIQGYLAMYPRINGQVSNITLQSILASFFRPDRYIRQGKPDETLDQTQPKRKRAKFYRTAKAATPALFKQVPLVTQTVLPPTQLARTEPDNKKKGSFHE